MSAENSLFGAFGPALAAVDFVPTRRGRLRKGRLVCSRNHGWLELRSTGRSPLRSRPFNGLWRQLDDTLVAELPLWLPNADPETIVPWLLASYTGSQQSHGNDAAAAAAAALTPDMRSVLAGPVTRTIEPRLTDAGLGLEVELASANPPAPDRRDLLNSVLAGTRHHWRMATIDQDEGGRVSARIDLSGAPADWIEPLAIVGIAVLRHVATATAATLEAILDPNNPLLEECR